MTYLPSVLNVFGRTLNLAQLVLAILDRELNRPPSPLVVLVVCYVWSLFIIVLGCVTQCQLHSQQHTCMSSSYRSSRLGLSHWDPYTMHRGGCLELYYCNKVEWSWWDSSLIWKTNWFPLVLWHCWFGHMTCKNRPRYDYNVLNGTLSLYTTTTSMKFMHQRICCVAC